MLVVMLRAGRPRVDAVADEAQVQRRNVVSSIFVGGLIALSLKEVLPPIREAVRSEGLAFEDWMLVIAYVVTAFRFFVGNMQHIQSKAITKLSGKVWFFDLSVIAVESLLLAFMAGLTSTAAAADAGIRFQHLILALYAIDVVWIVGQGILSCVSKSWARESIPWQWAVLNTLMIAALTIPRVSGTAEAALLGVLSAAAFVYDFVVVDYAEIFRSRMPRSSGRPQPRHDTALTPLT